ncbi:MAG TPA: hypothetical protein ENK57_15495, partial [Polyangiaceae bacterium]|nr:hypothetical protein [Polyangiaceae bacterium]
MSKGSAIISILIAFVAGLTIGSLVTSDRGGDEPVTTINPEASPSAPAAAAELGENPAAEGDTVRLRAEVPENAPQRGPDDALVTIVMWSDYQCPFCSRVEPTVTQIVNEHPNDVRVVWRDNPLPFHQN